MNVKVILQVAYMSAFRPSFCLNGSFAKFLVTDIHTHVHVHTPLRKRGVTTELANAHAQYSIMRALIVVTAPICAYVNDVVI